MAGEASQAKQELRAHLAARYRELWPETAAPEDAPPRPPEFPGRGRAAERLRRLPEYRSAQAVAVMPDPVLNQARVNLLNDRKTLLGLTPGLKQGMVRITPDMVPVAVRGRELRGHAMSPAGRPLRLPHDRPGRVDLLLGAALAVDGAGRVLGDGRGLWDLAACLLAALGSLGAAGRLVVLVDEAQMVEELPGEAWDWGADLVVTPERTLRPGPSRPKPDLDHLPPRLAGLPLVQAVRGMLATS